jgi:hypothetical protein
VDAARACGEPEEAEPWLDPDVVMEGEELERVPEPELEGALVPEEPLPVLPPPPRLGSFGRLVEPPPEPPGRLGVFGREGVLGRLGEG